MATRLRTASTDLVRKAICGLTASAAIRRRVDSSISSTINTSGFPSAWGAANVCYQSSAGGALVVLAQTHAYFQFPVGQWNPISVNNSVIPGAGTWNFGMCQAFTNAGAVTYMGQMGFVFVSN